MVQHVFICRKGRLGKNAVDCSQLPENDVPVVFSLVGQRASEWRAYQFVCNVRYVGVADLQEQRQVPIDEILEYPGILLHVTGPFRVYCDVFFIESVGAFIFKVLGLAVYSFSVRSIVFSSQFGKPRGKEPVWHVLVEMRQCEDGGSEWGIFQYWKQGFLPDVDGQPFTLLYGLCSKLYQVLPSEGQVEIMHRVPCTADHTGKDFPFCKTSFAFLYKFNNTQQPVKFIGSRGIGERSGKLLYGKAFRMG